MDEGRGRRAHRRAVLVAVAGTLGAALGAACSPSPSSGDEVDGLEVRTRRGTVVVPRRARRVVALGVGDAEAAISLGVVPVAACDLFGRGDALRSWVRARIGSARQPVLLAWQQPPLERVVALRPDLVLRVNAPVDDSLLDDLASIAPTVGPPVGDDREQVVAWRDQLALVGEALGRPARARQVQHDVEQQVAAARVAHPELVGRTFVAGVARPDQVYLYPPEDPRVELLVELGLVLSPAVAGLDRTGYLLPLSPERLDLLEADVVHLAARGPGGAVEPSLLAGGAFQRLSATVEGRVVLAPGPALTDTDTPDGEFASAFAVGGPLGIPACLGRLVDDLVAAVSGRAPGLGTP